MQTAGGKRPIFRAVVEKKERCECLAVRVTRAPNFCNVQISKGTVFSNISCRKQMQTGEVIDSYVDNFPSVVEPTYQCYGS